MIKMFQEFMQDNDGWEMFVTGPAGSGKTTDLAMSVQCCIDNEIPYVVCAFTHQACCILRSKLPEGANVMTLHAFLTKRPTVNEHAKCVDHLEQSKKHGTSELYDVMFLDEYSQIGERDYADIGFLQNPTDDDPDAPPALRVVYIGDSNQLPPVGDQAAIFPHGKYQLKLTHIYRQQGDNQLLGTLSALVNMIEKRELGTGLVEHDTFKRGVNIINAYKNAPTPDKVMLAYTNEKVEELNVLVADKSKPDHGDHMFSPTLKQEYTLYGMEDACVVYSIHKSFGEDPLDRGSKYKTLEHLINMECCEFMNCYNLETAVTGTFAVVFGHYQYKLMLDKYKYAAASANAAIGDNAKTWAANNKTHPKARTRAKAWRDYFAFKECVVCMDFPYAMTVHKSQGSTYDTVCIDTNDLYKCAERNYELYLKLMYVAISRSSNMVYTT